MWLLRNVAIDLHCKNPIKSKGHLPACFRARFGTHSETPFLVEKQDTGKEATICKQMPKDELLHPQELLWVY